jgi:phosphatidylserine/phosphatidylglycerophosphate/cardiolipin synthase-like enzyme
MSDLSFFVLPDDGLTPLLDAIAKAQHTLDVYIFKMENDEIEQAFGSAAQRGVQVRAILDATSPTAKAAYERLTQAGLDVKWAPTYFVKSHAKCFVADNAIAAIFTLNFVTSWASTRDYGITSNDHTIISAFNATFAADWQAQSDHPTVAECGPLIISPVNSRAALSDFIARAKHSLFVEEEQFSDSEVIQEIAACANAGVQVSMALGEKESKEGANQLRHLAPAVQVVYPTTLKTHAKLLIRDESAMLLGSLNPTSESLDQRREVSLVVSEPQAVSRAVATFKHDFGGQ